MLDQKERSKRRNASPQTRPLCIWHQERLRFHPHRTLENPVKTNKKDLKYRDTKMFHR